MKNILEFIKRNKKELLIFLGGFTVCLFIVGGIFIYNYQSTEKDEKVEKPIENKKSNKKRQKEAVPSINDVEIVENNQPDESDNIKEEALPSNISATTSSYDNTTASENEVISYFSECEKLSMSNNNESVRSKLKSGLDNIYRFLFENGTIRGKTFKELSSAAKLKVLKITLSIDQKIDYYFPGYKDRIKASCRNLKAKVITKYLETTGKICSNHEDICTVARKDFYTMKKSFKISWSLIKEVAKESTTALKEWYQST